MSVGLIVRFPGTDPATPSAVGGKGYSLIRMAMADLPVPPGAVLTSEFFAPWIEDLLSMDRRDILASAPLDELPALCADLVSDAGSLQATAEQRRALESVVDSIPPHGDARLLAVRSSSPEEDLKSASFAGLYVSRLGVRAADLEDAVRHSFASCVDERVVVYKRERGFDPLPVGFAVVVQRQIDAEVAGVGFSINPVTNDFDEAVIDANWGLGQSVVDGSASPDSFVVDTVGRRILDRKLGAKHTSIRLNPDGGTTERPGRSSGDLCLDDEQVLELTDVMGRIEQLFQGPIDMEWAFAGGRLHLLQARPITAYVPLPPEMITSPGEKRRLYADAALSKGMTTNSPISPLGLDWIKRFNSIILASFGIGASLEDGLMFYAGSRMYMNMSNLMRVGSLKRLSKASAVSDALLAEILAGVDETAYRADKRPSWIRLGNLLSIPRVLWQSRGLFRNTLRSVVSPEKAHRIYLQSVDEYATELLGDLDYDLSLDDFQRMCAAPLWRHAPVTMAALAAGLAALGLVRIVAGRRSAENSDLAGKLQYGFSGDVVVEMGAALSRAARTLTPGDFEDLDRLAERVRQRRMSAEFLDAWDAFLGAYGWRGPSEMDLASPRYADDPILALCQMSSMGCTEGGFDPAAVHDRLVEERRRAFDELMSRLGWLRRMLLRRVHKVIDLFAGARDMPKHQLVLFNYVIRKRVLMEGELLANTGRLDAAEDVFDLTFDDLESAGSDAALDLREVRAERTHFLEMLRGLVTEFPQVFDSRGRILRPPPSEERPGELRGMAVSPGTATGPVKLLRDPRKQPILEGDVLVAYATDPGWTPLFATAAAVVLEVGGMLQHGALVAREYGKPCVVGIDRLMERLHDGQHVEVDGSTGIVRILPE